ncbi:Chemotaxis protein CheV [Propionispora sp. 2/2-37]|uniref:chemotaxis protein n=1 Tax=Propionispora sp. 2/2-37 TaxID=1677858 RepID=UPI0006BB775B|nr:chemotaxis protein [Propionispora sp. 2/2-37]CUH97471.1 Chemotaxis protein CheV [Propionispora sp. 2/2-37]
MSEKAGNKKGILLETGTNEFEIIEFTVGKVSYGINVAKVREVINPVPVTKMPHSHPYVDGVFTLRGRVMPLVNLPRCLDAEEQSNTKNIIVSELNNYFVGFLVDEVSRIYRVSWTAMETPPDISDSDLVVGLIKMNEKIIVLLDFEKIVSVINPEINIKLTTIPQSAPDLEKIRQTKTIVVAEDSPMLRELLVGTLHTSGYQNIKAYYNGKEAWEALEAMAESEIPIAEKIQMVITDIEMPQMDGHHLLKKIKNHPRLRELPVIIFSSLINEEMRRKGEAIGANGQISKPEIGQLIDLVDKIIL